MNRRITAVLFRVFPGLLSVLFFAPSSAGQAGGSCEAGLQRAIHAMAAAVDSAPHHAYVVELGFKASNAKGTQAFTAVAHFEEGRIFFETPQYRYYQDAHTRLATLPEERTAFVYENAAQAEADEHVKIMNMWQDTLLQGGDVVECRTTTDPRTGARRRTITMQLPARLATTGVRRVTWTIDPDHDRILHARVDYAPGAPLQSMDVDYRRFTPGMRDPRARYSLEQVFLADGGRTGPLKGYALNDRRRRTTP